MCLVHEPWDPTPDSNQPGGKTKGGLRASVEYMDTVVGRIVESLDEFGLRDKTIVFFTGDNGTGKAGKGKTIESGVRVPMIVSGPGVKAGETSDALIDFSDMLPTLAELKLTGARLPEGVTIDGRSFAPALRGERGKEREWIFSYLRTARMLRDRRWLLEGNGKLHDCGDSRDGTGYKDVSDSTDPAVAAARERFNSILKSLPAPAAPNERTRPRRAGRTRSPAE
jgi:arylsulfatase A